MQHSVGSAAEPTFTSHVAQRKPVVAVAHRARFGSQTRRADRHLGRPVGAHHDDAEVVLDAFDDAAVQHGAAEIHRTQRDRPVRRRPPRRAAGPAIGRDPRTRSPRATRADHRLPAGSQRSSRITGAVSIGAMNRACNTPVTEASGLIRKIRSAGPSPATCDVVRRRLHQCAQRVDHALGLGGGARGEQDEGRARRPRATRCHWGAAPAAAGHGIQLQSRRQRLGRSAQFGARPDATPVRSTIVSDLRRPGAARHQEHHRIDAQRGVHGHDRVDVVAYQQQHRCGCHARLRRPELGRHWSMRSSSSA